MHLDIQNGWLSAPNMGAEEYKTPRALIDNGTLRVAIHIPGPRNSPHSLPSIGSGNSTTSCLPGPTIHCILGPRNSLHSQPSRVRQLCDFMSSRAHKSLSSRAHCCALSRYPLLIQRISLFHYFCKLSSPHLSFFNLYANLSYFYSFLTFLSAFLNPFTPSSILSHFKLSFLFFTLLPTLLSFPSLRSLSPWHLHPLPSFP